MKKPLAPSIYDQWLDLNARESLYSSTESILHVTSIASSLGFLVGCLQGTRQARHQLAITFQTLPMKPKTKSDVYFMKRQAHYKMVARGLGMGLVSAAVLGSVGATCMTLKEGMAIVRQKRDGWNAVMLGSTLSLGCLALEWKHPIQAMKHIQWILPASITLSLMDIVKESLNDGNNYDMNS